MTSYHDLEDATYRAVVAERFQEQVQQDAAEFFQLLLTRMRTVELQAGRATEWFGMSSVDQVRATHVDRLSGFVEETRLQCKGV